MEPHPYHTRSKARQAISPAPDPTDSRMRSHCASPPTFSPASSNGDARMRSHSVAPPISKPESLIKDFHMHSGSANPPILKSDSLDGNFHVHSRSASPPTSKPNTLDEIFHMHSYSAILPTSDPTSPDEDAQRCSHSSSRSQFDPASLGDNVYELSHNYFGPTRWSEFLKSHSPVSCPYLCEHWPYMAATHDRYLPYSGENLHLLEPRETAKKHSKTPDDLEQASITSDDQTTEEDWRPSSRDYSVRNAKEDPIPWAEWTNLPSSLENSPTQTPLENLPLVAPYRRSGPLHLDNDRIQEHSATMSSQRPKARSWAYCLDPQNPTSTANQQLGSEPRPLDVKEALYLVCSTKAQRQAPESTFALRASSKNPFMGHDFPYLDDGFNEFAKSSLDSTLELPYRYGAVSWQPDPALSIDVFTQNWYATWQEIHRITYELKVERTYILYTRVLIHLVRGSINEGPARTYFDCLLQNEAFRHLQPRVADFFSRSTVDVLRANAIFVEERLGPEHPTAFTFNIPRKSEKKRVLDRKFLEVMDEMILMDLRLKKLVLKELQRRYECNKIFRQRMNVEDVPVSLREVPILENGVKAFLDRLKGTAMNFDVIMKLVALSVKAGETDLPALGTFGVPLSRTMVAL